MRVFPRLILIALAALLMASGEPGPESPAKTENAAHAGEQAGKRPGYEKHSKRTLWETAERFKAKWKDEQLAHAKTQVELERLKRKLAERTSERLRKMVVTPPPPAAQECDGHSTWTLLGSNVVTNAISIAITAAIASKQDEPQTIVVK